MSRQYCADCCFPDTACICHAVTRVNSQTAIHIMQHPSELKAAKGTVRLLQLILPQTNVHIGENPEDFSELQQRVQLSPDNWALLYPSEHAVLANSELSQRIHNVIAIDGTWKKAWRILQLNPWLRELKTLTFSSELQSQYRIRKAKVENSFSTIESVGLCLHALEGLSLSPFDKILEARMATFESHLPQAD